MCDIFPLSTIGAESDLSTSLPSKARVLWGVAPTGSIHLGYAAYLLLLRRFQSAGAEVSLLIANYHGYLDSGKTQWNELEERTLYYKETFRNAGFNSVLETKELYSNDEYVESLFRFSAYCDLHGLLAAGQGTLRALPENALASDVLYIITQILDAQLLQANLVVCGMDESPIYRYGLPILTKQLGQHFSYAYMPQCPGILAPEMHASDGAANKILLSDTPQSVQEKIEAHCASRKAPPPLAEFCIKTLFPLAGRSDLSKKLDSAVRQNTDVARLLSDGISAVLQELRKA